MREIDVDLYCEDIDQEFLLRPLVERIARECEVAPVVHLRSVRGGKGKVREQVTARQKAVQKGQPGFPVPDLLIVGVDANSDGTSATRTQVQGYVDLGIMPRLATACPDPHIERWYVADPEAFTELAGIDPTLPKERYSKDVYKRHLRELLDSAAIEVLLGAYEIGPDIAATMDLYVAGKADHGFKIFVDEVRGACQSIRAS